MNILNKIWNEDCVGKGVGMSRIADKSVDMILCDLPYGTTACKWDTVIPFDKLWDQYERVIKDNGAIVLTASQPFTTDLIISNRKWFKYEWIWHKSKCGSAFTSKYRPQQKHENVLVFGKGKITYNPILIEGEPYYRKRKPNDGDRQNNHKLGVVSESETVNTGFRYPETVQFFQQKWRRQDQLHPTQKPVALFEYLIRTYTNEGDLVVDNCSGSFTTAVSCENTNRNWICIEQDREYCKIGWKRIQENRIRLESLTQLNQKSA